ncbi:MAG: hypothetical protein GY946_25130 [bacterium]|nr:hypothetical protein [bacterium]
MPAGDAQRVWFPEMLEKLKRSWSKTMSWEELADFCARMTEKRKQIREERGIQPPKTRCPKCGKVSRSDISGVSIRSALFALKNSGVVTDAQFKELDKSWMKHRKKYGVDTRGRQESPKSPRMPTAEDKCSDDHQH